MGSLGAYERIKSLGRGSCGAVSLMVRNADRFACAIKHIDLDTLSEKEKENTQKEVEVMSRIVHPNVVCYFESFIEDGSLHIVMEYADGGTLQRQWKKAQEANVHFSEEQILYWTAQITSALKYVHGQKIMHRDLKLANIMLTKQNVVKIADFGLARVLGSNTQFANTTCGTPYYLSPEVCLEKPYDLKSDSWALGCIVYELAMLKRPFDAKNLPSIVMKICHGDPKSVSSAYSIELRSLIACLLEKKPHERPSMDEITRMPFFKPHLDRAEAVADAAKPPVFKGAEPKALNADMGGGKSPVPGSPVPKDSKVTSRFEKMRSKLASNPKSPSASLSAADKAEAPAPAEAEEPACAKLEESAPAGMFVAPEDGKEDGKEEAPKEAETGVGESMLDVLEFTKSLLFKDDSGEGANLAKRVYDCSKQLRDLEAEDEAAVLEKLWEDALGKASNGEEVERVAKEAEKLSETLRGRGLEEQAEEVERIFSEASFDSGTKKGDGCMLM